MMVDQLDRRAFLAALAATGARAAGSRLSPSEFRRRLRGPIVSVPTVYHQDFSLDLPGVRRIVDTGVKAGGTVFAELRGQRVPMRISALPFAPHRYKR